MTKFFFEFPRVKRRTFFQIMEYEKIARVKHQKKLYVWIF